MANIQIQTVHGVSSPIVRGLSVDSFTSTQEPRKEERVITTQLYRDETAKRLDENNRRAQE